MGQNRLLKEYGKYVCLNVLGMIGLSCYILADTFFVSLGLGNAGLTALNLAIPVYSAVHGTGLMLGNMELPAVVQPLGLTGLQSRDLVWVIGNGMFFEYTFGAQGEVTGMKVTNTFGRMLKVGLEYLQ